MLLAEPPQSLRFPRRMMKASGLISFVLIALAVALLSLNAKWPSAAYVSSAQVTAALSLGLALVSLLSGIVFLSRKRPDLRWTVVVIVVVTVFIFLVHLYTINDPPTSVGQSVTGQVGSSFGDNILRVGSSLTGSQLKVTITDSGTNRKAVANVTVSLGSEVLPSKNLSFLPTFDGPLQPSDTAVFGYPTKATGTWTVASNASSQLTVNYVYLDCYHPPDSINKSGGNYEGVYGCAFDEFYYVPWASHTAPGYYNQPRGFLYGTQCSIYLQDCNLEHPPLAKALIAGGIAVFGLDTFGWRIAMAVLGTLSIPLLFVLVFTVSGNKRLAYFSMVLLALDVMFFTHSSLGVIDIPTVFFSLLAFIFYFYKTSLWKFDNFMLSGAFLGLAILSKESGILAPFVLIGYELVFDRRGLRSFVARTSKLLVPAALVFFGGLQLYDSLFTSLTYPWFYQQLTYMIHYRSILTAKTLQCLPVTGYWCLLPNSPGGPPILPYDWILFYSPVVYSTTTVFNFLNGHVVSSYVTVGYYGITNPIVTWLVFAWAPLVVYVLWKRRRLKTPLAGDEKMAALALLWFLVSYLPYFVVFYYGTVTYPYYMIPAVPALASGAGYFITRGWFSRRMAIFYVIAAFAIFFLYFPSKDFLPIAIRELLRR